MADDNTPRYPMNTELRRYLSLSDQAVVGPTSAPQFITVSPELAFAERIARGNYDRTNPDVTEKNFPVTADQLGEWEWSLFCFDCILPSEEIIRLMRDHGFEPAQIGHILAFGERYPEEQLKYDLIIGLGSIAKINLNLLISVFGLWGCRGERGLDLFWFADRWRGSDCFLGVRRRALSAA